MQLRIQDELRKGRPLCLHSNSAFFSTLIYNSLLMIKPLSRTALFEYAIRNIVSAAEAWNAAKGRLRAQLVGRTGIGGVELFLAPRTTQAVRWPERRLNKGGLTSSGTWSLVGVERDEVLINEDLAAAECYELRWSIRHDPILEERHRPCGFSKAAGKNGSSAASPSIMICYCATWLRLEITGG